MQVNVIGFRPIACNYLQGWFTIDLISSVPLQLIPGLEDDNQLEALRGLKILKLVKLLRVFRLTRMIALMQERFQIKHATVMIAQFTGTKRGVALPLCVPLYTSLSHSSFAVCVLLAVAVGFCFY